MALTRRRLAAAAAIAVTVAPGVSAHRRDEYLQAARIDVEPDRVGIELDLTPGMTLARSISREIDQDGTGAISPSEGAEYAALVVKSLRLEVDGTPLPLELTDGRFPSLEAMVEGVGTIRLRISGRMPVLGAGTHQLFYRNNHHPDVGAYLANALVPSDGRIAVTGQRRDINQHELTIAFVLRPGQAIRPRLWLLGGVVSVLALLAALWRRRSGGG